MRFPSFPCPFPDLLLLLWPAVSSELTRLTLPLDDWCGSKRRIGRLSAFLAASSTRQAPKKTNTPRVLDNVVDMRKEGQALAAAIGLNGQVDLEHHGKANVRRLSSSSSSGIAGSLLTPSPLNAV